MKQRIITAILALIVFLPIVIIGDLPFTLFIYLIATIGLMELLRMRHIPLVSIPGLIGMIGLWLILLPDQSAIFPIGFLSITDIYTVIILFLLAYTVLVRNKFTFDEAGFVLLTTLYVGIGFYFLVETRLGTQGFSNILFAFFIIWATDTGAYFVGRALGKRKLWPDISPNKTVEGAIGGILAAVIVAVIFHLIQPFPHSLVIVIIVSIFASIVGQVGDLVESAFKRNYGVKDSGKLLPGHGGILDRFDSLLFVLPFLHLIQFI
ncbi:phosphatidate cytidylyltransferase [Oceanobacillus luteolus]|uniref:Phosphatidate cytidylyltransferase n=1 Tax=Oceanobacillus luteolus TaxID=1274358 RepID=A0ABW4HQ38_9BACI|nr:phosphatidate cytidylyltransferase [Oceanobacillus luteolus]MCM3739014.1 phosphatidate cytidylyltransferase [Oceanobacillus luteolus]